MKFSLKFATVSALALLAFGSASKANVTLNFYAGDLRYTPGGTSTLMPVGGLLELVADTSRNGFSLPTANAFVSGDDVVIATFALNGNLTGSAIPGQTANTLVYTPGNFAGLDAGDPLIFRWFPTLTTASTIPGTNTVYGQFNTITNQDGSSLPTPWAEPGDGNTYTLAFITASEGGANPNALGFAIFTTAVPEPTTYALFACGVAGIFVLKAWQRRRLAAAV